MKHGKKYINALNQVNREELLNVPEAVTKVKALATAKFDETIEIACRLGVDPRKADQIVRGTIALPAGTGKTMRIAVFAAGEAATAAREAGADHVGADDLVAKVAGGFLDFDIAIATPDQMGQVGGLGRVLGPRGLMPNPKTGTVTDDTSKAVREVKAGRIDFKLDKNGNVSGSIGKASFDPVQLFENGRAFVEGVVRAKPAAAKGNYIRSATLAASMLPGLPLEASTYTKPTA